MSNSAFQGIRNTELREPAFCVLVVTRDALSAVVECGLRCVMVKLGKEGLALPFLRLQQ